MTYTVRFPPPMAIFNCLGEEALKCPLSVTFVKVNNKPQRERVTSEGKNLSVKEITSPGSG